MALVLDGSAGISGVDGTASNPAIEGTDSNTGIFYPAADTVAIGTGGTEALRVNSSQNVGIGTSSPTNKLHVLSTSSEVARFIRDNTSNASGGITIGNNSRVFTIYGDNSALSFWDTTAAAQRMTLDASGNLGIGTSSPQSRLHVSDAVAGGQLLVTTNETNSTSKIGSLATMHYTNSEEPVLAISVEGGASENIVQIGGGPGEFNAATVIKFSTAANTTTTGGTERARITSDGKLLVGTTTTLGGLLDVYQTSNAKVAALRSTNASQTNPLLEVLADRNTTNNTYYAIQTGVANVAYRFQVADSGNVTNTNSSYGAISDIKLKQDIVDAGSQWSDIKNLRFRKFRWKSEVIDNQNAPAYLGVIAQEAEQISPSLIEEHTDRDSDGNDLGTVTKSVKYSILYMKAVKALQEAMTRIEQLEAKVAALENA